MHHQAVLLEQSQTLLAQPLDQALPIRRVQHVVQRVVRARRSYTVGHGQQMQVVIAQDAARCVPQVHQTTQHSSRIRPPIHQVAKHIKHVTAGGKTDFAQQLPKGRVTTLDIAHQIVRHEGDFVRS